MHHFSDKFSSVTDLKVKLLDQFGAQLPATTLFNVGYFDGRQSMKVCICSQDDLDKMYTSLASAKKREVLLWCDGRAEDGNSQKKDKYCEKEVELDKLIDEIKDIHEGDEYTEPQYRLWARMIQNGIHVSKHDPPQIPLITGVAPVCKKQKIEESNVEQTIISTATAIVKALQPGAHTIQQTVVTESQPSPGKAADVRGKCLAQLSVIKKLFDEKVLTEEELLEQKVIF